MSAKCAKCKCMCMSQPSGHRGPHPLAGSHCLGGDLWPTSDGQHLQAPEPHHLRHRVRCRKVGPHVLNAGIEDSPDLLFQTHPIMAVCCWQVCSLPTGLPTDSRGALLCWIQGGLLRVHQRRSLMSAWPKTERYLNLCPYPVTITNSSL